jgi:hypothetical protein
MRGVAIAAISCGKSLKSAANPISNNLCLSQRGFMDHSSAGVSTLDAGSVPRRRLHGVVSGALNNCAPRFPAQFFTTSAARAGHFS